MRFVNKYCNKYTCEAIKLISFAKKNTLNIGPLARFLFPFKFLRMAKVNKISNSIAIDSTKIRIPINLVSHISEKVVRQVISIDAQTSEVLDEYKQTSYMHVDRGIKTFFKVETQETRIGKQEFFTMLITSKILGCRYLEGITKNNIHLIHEYIQDIGLVKFSYSTFMNGELTDTDFKLDFTNYHGSELITKLYEITNFVKAGRGASKFNQKHVNEGIQWSERKSTNFKTAPYWKVYNKHLDLKTHSNEFAQHFDIHVPSNYWRSEVTIKNKKHYRAHNISDSTLSNILTLEQTALSNFFITAQRAHIIRRTKKSTREGISPKDRVDYNFICYCLNLGNSFFEVVQIGIEGLNGANKTKKTELLNKIYQTHIKNTIEGLKSQSIDATFEAMGIVFN